MPLPPNDERQGHIPVLLSPVLEYMAPQPGKVYVDATLGGGGHARAVLERIQPEGRLLGIDQDPAILAETRQKLSGQPGLLTCHGNYSELPSFLAEADIERITGGVLADLGVSSFQLDQAERGFSFSKTAPLDMRMNTSQGQTAADVVNAYPEEALVRIFSEYGEEHLSKTIAREIVSARRTQSFQLTTELAELITSLYRKTGKIAAQRSRIHPATRVFQALRIEVNDELGHLTRFLETLPPLLAPGSRIVVISFHSLEDRIVKQFFQQESRDCICPPGLPVCQCGHQATLKVLTPKPVTATPDETLANPRARSAKLRAAERV